METLLAAARLLLACVFAAAGAAKLWDLKGSRKAVTDFGLPPALAGPLGLLLPLAELAVAGLLLPASTARWGAVGALALLALFLLGISANLVRGRRPDCHCFGQLYSEPIGAGTVVRNGLLAALAALLVWAGPGRISPDAWGHLSPVARLGLVGGLLVTGALGLQWLVLVGLLRQNGRLLVRLEAVEAKMAGATGVAAAPAAEPAAAPARGLPVGVPAPDFQLPGLHGETLTLGALRGPGRPVLLVFSDPGCGPCGALLPEIARWQRERAGALTVALVSRGTADANRAKLGENKVSAVLLQNDREVAAAYQASGTPAAVLVNSDGTIGSPLATGAQAIEALAQSVPIAVVGGSPRNGSRNGHAEDGHVGNGRAAEPAARPALTLGQPAPTFTLPDLTGRPVSLDEFRGKPTLVLFWNPACGFCQKMLDDLKLWEADPAEGAPRLVVVSTGTPEVNRALGLRAPVLLDDGYRIGASFGAGGTPMAVLLDDALRVASPVIAGGPAVLAAVRGQQAPLAPRRG